MAKSLMSRKYRAEGRRKQLNHCPWRDAKEVEPNHGQMETWGAFRDKYGAYVKHYCTKCKVIVSIYI